MAKLDDIVDIFELLGDWDQRYQYLIELGEKLPAMPAQLKVDDNKVKGCMSQVWIAAESKNGIIHFQGDSDNSVIKGIVALLIELSADMKASEIKAMNMDEIFERLNLDANLSPNRHVGVYAIFDLMKQKATSAEKNTEAA